MHKKELLEKEEKYFKEYKKGFNKTFITGAIVSFLIAVLFYVIDNCNCTISNFPEEICETDLDVFKDISIGIVGVIAIMLGFLFTSVSVFCSGLLNHYNTLTNPNEKANVDSYWNLIIRVTRYPVFFSIIIIFYMILIVVFYKILFQINVLLPLYIFGIGLSGLIIYMLFDRVFDYFSNPKLK
jgi:hypothetical protein